MTGAWVEPRARPTLGAEEAHIWLASLAELRPRHLALRELLPAEERQRAQRFRREEDRARWELTRAVLRQLLANYAGQPAHEIQFTLGAHGKPALASPAGLHFNTSHSGGYAAFAITRLGEIGIDIEEVRADRVRGDEIARRYFAAGEQAGLLALDASQRPRAFFDTWARKEAFVKARGDGLFSGLEQFEVSLSEARLLRVPEGRVDDWWMGALPEIPGYAGAVVVRAARCTPKFWHARGLLGDSC